MPRHTTQILVGPHTLSISEPLYFSLFATEDKFAWLRDDEFARQALAGINPVAIERLRVI